MENQRTVSSDEETQVGVQDIFDGYVDHPRAWESTRRERSSRSEPSSLSWKFRLKHFTWTWFTLTMATGGIASVIWNVPAEYEFRGLFEIGVFFMFLNIVIFICNWICICLRFYWFPSTLKASFLHPTESLFTPAPIISISIILANITQYGLTSGKTGIWLNTTMAVFWWIYIFLSVSSSAGIYLMMWSTQTFTIAQMTPVWIFPAYPLLTGGTFAAALSHPATGRAGASALRIIISGVIIEGIGFMVTLMMYSAYLYRLMTQKLPAESVRPGMFISVGPSGFAITALVNMGINFAEAVPSYYPDFMGNGYLAAQITKVLAFWAGVWLWGLASWFFIVSVGAHATCTFQRRLHFSMTWSSFIFPNTGYATATFALAKALDQKAFAILGCIMAIALVITWIFLIIMAVRAIIQKQLLWPQEQEDKDVDIRMQRKFRATIASSNPPIMTPMDEFRTLDWGSSSGVSRENV